MTRNKKFLLGKNTEGRSVYLEDFSWDCGWYWGGGYIKTYDSHSHFDQFLGANCIEKRKEFFSECRLSEKEWYRLCDLFSQFYAYKKSAECFKHGGQYTSYERKEDEINLEMAKTLNEHLEKVVIREIRNMFDK